MDFPSHPTLNGYTGFLLRKVSAVSFERFAAVTGEYGLHPMHFGVLTVLDEAGPISQHDLSRRIGVDPSTMVGRMDVLEEKGMVERRRRAEDRRAYEITMTSRGVQTLNALRAKAEVVFSETFGVLSDEELLTLRSMLQRVAAAIDERVGVPQEVDDA